jgi:hypothetical protein
MTSKSSSSPNLDNLVKVGALHAEPPSRDEVQRLLTSAEGLLRDARLPQLGAEGRFRLAYASGFALALAALRAMGYRPVQGKGQRAIAFQVLEHTCGADKATVVSLIKSHERRNASEYEGVPLLPRARRRISWRW